MARADILVSMVRSVKNGDQTTFRKAVESLIAEERKKKHHILADRLLSSLNNGEYKTPVTRPNGDVFDLLFETVPKKNFKDLILDPQTVTLCNEITEEQHRSDLLRSYGLEPRNRILLAGPPGNGKTSLAEALAERLMCPLLVVRYENLIGRYLGETATRLKKVFNHVRNRSCVLFFDEFDTIGKERGDTRETGEIKRVVSSLLLQIDSLPSYVVVVTASNHPELLDRAVWRRFQLSIELKHPTKNQIEDFIHLFSNRTKFNFQYSPKTLSQKLLGNSFSEIEEFCTDVVRQAVLTGNQNNCKKIVSLKLKQWNGKFRIKSIEK